MPEYINDLPAGEPRALTSADLKALRKGDDLIVTRNVDGNGSIRVIKRADWNEPFDTDRNWDIPVEATMLKSGLELTDGAAATKALAHLTSYRHGRVWPTILRVLRAGDRLELVFYPDAGTNGYVKDARLHADEVYLVVHRKGEVAYEFLVDCQITPSNFARMVRP